MTKIAQICLAEMGRILCALMLVLMLGVIIHGNLATEALAAEVDAKQQEIDRLKAQVKALENAVDELRKICKQGDDDGKD